MASDQGRIAFRRTEVPTYHEGDAVIVTGAHEVSTKIEGTGVRLWEALEYAVEPDALIDRLADEYIADPTTVASDVRDALATMVDSGLVERVPAPSPGDDARNRYLWLIKRSLVNLMYPELEVGLNAFLDDALPIDRPARVRALRDIAKIRPDIAKKVIGYKRDGRTMLPYSHTMIGLRRLDNIERCVETILADDIAGDFMEAGVCQGGATIFMRALMTAHGATDRTLWVADSFQGLPPASDPVDVEAGMDFTEEKVPWLAFDIEWVRERFRRYDLLSGNVRFIEGWFSDSLPTAPIEQLALLRLDADLYSSTTEILTNLYDKVVPGGFVIVDDYHAFEPCKRAIDEFRATRGIDEPLRRIDWSSAYWRRNR